LELATTSTLKEESYGKTSQESALFPFCVLAQTLFPSLGHYFEGLLSMLLGAYVMIMVGHLILTSLFAFQKSENSNTPTQRWPSFVGTQNRCQLSTERNL
jgi:hypothetical protein